MTCNLPLAALEAFEPCPRCGSAAGHHRHHRSYVHVDTPAPGPVPGLVMRSSLSRVTVVRHAILERLVAEREAAEAARDLASRQLALPKNRAKGVPTESARELLKMAVVECYEALDAMDEQAGDDRILAEIGDAVAFLGLAAWKVRR